MRAPAGFSLIEGILTVGIVGILLAIAIPAMRPVVKANELELDTERVVEALYATADLARASAARRCLRFEGKEMVLHTDKFELERWPLQNAGVNPRTVCFDAEGNSAPTLVQVWADDERRREVRVQRWGAVCVVGRSCE